ncbi:hypothetical protein K456DRAFT_1515633 [Colletotrichum gloeosporioides 23]|nr:hypothetical protein K456DRAFT_1515633 [Colletotrichum gloeosporioides 23]
MSNDRLLRHRPCPTTALQTATVPQAYQGTHPQFPHLKPPPSMARRPTEGADPKRHALMAKRDRPYTYLGTLLSARNSKKPSTLPCRATTCSSRGLAGAANLFWSEPSTVLSPLTTKTRTRRCIFSRPPARPPSTSAGEPPTTTLGGHPRTRGSPCMAMAASSQRHVANVSSTDTVTQQSSSSTKSAWSRTSSLSDSAMS